jgi:hypothetical protein
MNEVRELLAVPAERDMPSASFEQRKAALLEVVEADLRMADRARGRLRGLRGWLTSLGVILALIGVAGSTLLTTRVRPQGMRVAVEAAVVVGSGPVVASLAALPRPRSGGSALGGREQRRAIGGGRAPARVSVPWALA